MRLKSRPVVLKTPAPCRFCGIMIRDGHKLTGPVTDYICDRCYQQVYKEIIEAGAFRLSDLLTPEFWSPLKIGEEETAFAALTADKIRLAEKIMTISLLICLLVMTILVLPGSAPLSRIGLLFSRIGVFLNHLVQRLSDLHFL